MSDSLAAWSVGGNKYPGTKGGSVYGKCTNYNSINIEMCVRTSGAGRYVKDWYFENAYDQQHSEAGAGADEEAQCSPPLRGSAL